MPATTHRFSVEDYHRMGESGVFKRGQRVELLEGEIIDMMPIGPFHAGVVGWLNNFFASASGGRWLVYMQNPIRLSEGSEPQPDLVLLRPDPQAYKNRHPGPEDVFLVIEAADSSLAYDRNEKLQTYARAGLSEYWLIDLVQREIEIFREPNFLGYDRAQRVRIGRVAPTAFPDAEVDVAALLSQ